MADETPASPTAPAVAALTPVRRLAAIKAVFSGEYSGVRGAILIVMDLDEERLERLYAVIVGEGDETRYAVPQGWKDFEALIINAKLQGKIAHQTTGEVTGYFRRVLSEDVAGTLCEALRHEEIADVRRLLVDLVSRAIADTEILMEAAVERVEEAPPPAAAKAASAPVEGAAVAETAATATKEVRIRVDPILSPVTGIPAKEIKPGMKLRLQIRDLSTVKQHLAKLLSINVSGLEKGILTGQVVSVAPIEHDRVGIETFLAPGVTGVTNISGELRIQIMDRTARLEPMVVAGGVGVAPPGISSTAFLWISIGILAFLVILAYLIFGGFI